MLRAGVTIIDVGTTFVGDKLCGDVDAAAAEEFAADYTPVPGGVGPVTTATLLANVVESAERCIA
jgi:methylenetetrahydrofolate dehydrogenase (NADP+)/methenyltetrahydrofolate cyclohydrolase